LATCFFFQAEDGIRDPLVTGVQTCALPICLVSDYNMVVVRTESPYKTLKDWLDGAKAKPKGVSVGGTGIGNADHVQLANIEKRRSEERRVGKREGGRGCGK